MTVLTLNFLFPSPGTSIGVSSILLGLILAGRAAFVFPLSFLSNLTKKSPENKIELKQQVWVVYSSLYSFCVSWLASEVNNTHFPLILQVTIWWAGLMRGAVSMALAYNQVIVFPFNFLVELSFILYLIS